MRSAPGADGCEGALGRAGGALERGGVGIGGKLEPARSADGAGGSEGLGGTGGDPNPEVPAAGGAGNPTIVGRRGPSEALLGAEGAGGRLIALASSGRTTLPILLMLAIGVFV